MSTAATRIGYSGSLRTERAASLYIYSKSQIAISLLWKCRQGKHFAFSPLVVEQGPEHLPAVVTTHIREEIDPRIRKVAHDFFQPQPVVGARAYFFHAVPHDWPDADVQRMFAEIKKVMTPGYSKLIVYEVVMPAQGASTLATTLDLALMSCTSGIERTEEAWRNLLKICGFNITGIFRHPRALETVIEAETA